MSSAPEAKPKAPSGSKLPLITAALLFINLGISGAAAGQLFLGEIVEVQMSAEGDAHGGGEDHGGGGGEDHGGGGGEDHGGGGGDDHGGGGGHGEEGASTGDPLVVALEPFVVNLNETGSSRYLKAVFEVQMNNKRAAEDIKLSKRSVRDEIFRYLSSLSVTETLGANAKGRIQREIVRRIDQEIGKGSVKRLYFNEFVVQ